MTPCAFVRLHRTFAAPPARVYRAWLEPEVLVRWLHPTGLEVAHVEVDARVGGRVAIHLTGPDGDAGGFEAELLEVVPDERLVYRWRFVGPGRAFDPAHDSLLTITFAAAPGGGTEVTLVHERLDAIIAARPEMRDGVKVGWRQALGHLAEALA